MCGSLKTGTLDHIFPKNTFAEFSIYSRNLVPACDCNSLRGDDYKGARRGERVLHPYFDVGMNQRLLRATIKPDAGDFRRPLIGIEVCIKKANPLYPAVSYHLQTVVLRTKIIEYLESFWPKLLRFYRDYFRLPAGHFTIDNLNRAIREKLGESDRRRSTPNNWDSMLLAGLSANARAKAFVYQTILDLRAGRMTADAI
jgi:hypothetical protein